MNIRNALLLATSIIALSAALAFAVKSGWIDVETSERVSGVAMGLVMVVVANLVPKTLEPLSAGCSPAKVQAMQRFSGWTLVLGGLGYSLAWLVAPLAYAAVSAMAILGTGVLLVAARWAWTLKSRSDSGRPAQS